MSLINVINFEDNGWDFVRKFPHNKDVTQFLSLF